MILSHPILSELTGIGHGFLTRQGGVSRGLFESLNCGLGSGDDDEAVRENRLRALDRLDAGNASLLTARQVHSPDVARVTGLWHDDDRPQVDAMVTDRPGLVLGILTADCAPVLFADAAAGVIGAAHAGWKGALGGVLEATIDAMIDLGARRDRITAAVGPCIARDSYEVGADFRERFMAADSDNDAFFSAAARPGHAWFDLPAYVTHRLRQAAIGKAAALGRDTYGEESLFFSYRRTCHRQHKDYGRLLSAIHLT